MRGYIQGSDLCRGWCWTRAEGAASLKLGDIQPIRESLLSYSPNKHKNKGSEKEVGGVWSESGEHYLLVLFLDYIFNQVDDSGCAFINYGHVLKRVLSSRLTM